MLASDRFLQRSRTCSLVREGRLASGVTIALVSPYFPPSNVAGVHRTRHLAKHLPAVGWTPVVLSVDPVHHEEHLDLALAALIPKEIEVLKTGALPAGLTRALGVGDLS